MSYLYVASGVLGDSCTIDPGSGARVCSSAPASAPVGGGGRMRYQGGPARRAGGWGGGGSQKWRQPTSKWSTTHQHTRGRGRSQGTGAQVPGIFQPGLNYAPGMTIPGYGPSGGYDPTTGNIMVADHGSNLTGLGAIMSSLFLNRPKGTIAYRAPGFNTLAPVVPSITARPVGPARYVPPVAPVNPAVPGQWGGGQQNNQNSNRWKFNNRRGSAQYGASQYAPWNTSPVCSDSSSQFYDPSDPSCATGNNPICTDPTYPGYNPNDPSCAAINNAALVAAGATSSTDATTTTAAATTSTGIPLWIWLAGAGVILLIMMRK
jgi:hypothetical protein